MEVNTEPTDTGNLVPDILEAIRSRRFGVAYEPIIDLADGGIHGYEALARFYNRRGESLSRGPVFEGLHKNLWLFYLVELELKRLQLAHAPPEGLLFLNLDPHVYFVAGEEHPANPFLDLLARQKQRVVVEIMENSDISDALLSKRLLNLLRREGISAALDDAGHPRSLLSLEVLTGVSYLKFHMSFTQRLRRNDIPALYLKLPSIARDHGIRTILEGVETEADLSRARELEFDFAQGYLFAERGKLVRPETAMIAGLA